MASIINIYCDESCHLEHDKQEVMLLGAVKCPIEKVRHITEELRQLKEKHSCRGELKWQKVSNSRLDYYRDIIEYFFSQNDLGFRCVVVKNKKNLDHQYYNQGSHDSFYYKMYYYLLRNMITCESVYNIFMDIKDTQSQIKINTLKDILKNSYPTNSHEIINIMQQIRSKESEILQIADFFIGALSYVNRGLIESTAKLSLIELIKAKVKLTLTETTAPWEDKFNIFTFLPREKNNATK
ncbi:DUF3800 domain-containing protein [candidate division TA06 bacterium]|nr:DUF3800 domain-containing protein [candidate division TA06 bacterium]